MSLFLLSLSLDLSFCRSSFSPPFYIDMALCIAFNFENGLVFWTMALWEYCTNAKILYSCRHQDLSQNCTALFTEWCHIQSDTGRKEMPSRVILPIYMNLLAGGFSHMLSIFLINLLMIKEQIPNYPSYDSILAAVNGFHPRSMACNIFMILFYFLIHARP